jgi:hypothetical protein
MRAFSLSDKLWDGRRAILTLIGPLLRRFIERGSQDGSTHPSATARKTERGCERWPRGRGYSDRRLSRTDVGQNPIGAHWKVRPESCHMNIEPIAVTGVSVLLPGSADAAGFWRDVLAGKDLIGDVPESHWPIPSYYDPDPSAPDKTYCRRPGRSRPQTAQGPVGPARATRCGVERSFRDLLCRRQAAGRGRLPVSRAGKPVPGHGAGPGAGLRRGPRRSGTWRPASTSTRTFACTTWSSRGRRSVLPRRPSRPPA